MSKGPEARFWETHVKPFLKQLPFTIYFTISNPVQGGTPDRLVCINGRFVALELKAKRGKLSKLQEIALKDIQLARGVALVPSPQNWEVIKAHLTALSEQEPLT